MRRVKILIVSMMTAYSATFINAQSPDPVLAFYGTDDAENLSGHDVERLEELLLRPLMINHASESRLEETGLFTRYQIASLSDYRSRHGDVLSFSELESVDGFGHDFVSLIAPFISLESRRLPGQSGIPSLRNDISIRSGIRTGARMTYGLKYKMSLGERFSGGLSVSRTSEAGSISPDALSGHAALYLKRRKGKIVAGDFNVRFGQGLALWNGLSFSGLTSASSFMRKPSGISVSSSFTGGYAFRGIGADMEFGRTGIAAFAAVGGRDGALSILPAFNVMRIFRMGQVSLTHYADFSMKRGFASIPDMKTSADAAFCINGVDMFAEAAYDWVSGTAAALGGVTFGVGENGRMAAMLRHYPASYSSGRSAAARSTTKCSNEHAVSLAADFTAGKWVKVNGASGFGSSVRKHQGKVSADFAYFPVPKSASPAKSIQIKAQAEWTAMLSEAFRTTVRLSERVRTWGEPFRTDLRADMSFISRHFAAALRLNALHCVGLGLLGYAECTYKAERISVHYRQGIFRTDNWEDRIYAYERDAPGSFNVPAYYGRGIWTALVINWRFTWWGRIYMRAAATSYPFMEEKKPGRAELKFHCVIAF